MNSKTNLITILKELNDAIEEGAIDKIKQKIDWFHQDLERNTQLLRELHTSGSQGVMQTDLIIAVCRNRQAKFRNNEAEFRNSEAGFRNKEAEFRNFEVEFRNKEAEFHNSEAEFRNKEAKFRNSEAVFRNKKAEFRHKEAEFHIREVEFRNNEAEFRNSEAEFRNIEDELRNNEAEFRNRIAEFRNIEAKFRNKESEFRNKEAEFRNKEAEFRNKEAESRNSEAEFRIREVEFCNSEAEFRNKEVEFRNSEAEFRNKEAKFRNSEAEFRNKEAEFRNKEAEFCKSEAEFRNKEAEFYNSEAEFHNSEAEFCNKKAEIFHKKADFRNKEEVFRNNEVEFRNKEEVFRNNKVEFRNSEAEFRNIDDELRNNEAEFRNKVAEFRNIEAEFHNKEAEFHNKEAEFRNNEAEFHNREAEFRNSEAEFQNKKAEFRNKETEFRSREAEFCIKKAQFRTGEAEFRNKLVNILYYLLFQTDILYHLPDADLDDTEVKTQRTEAFKQALSWDAFPMVEMLYIYWIGDLHWIGHDINKITMLGEMLEAARVVCAVENQQLLIDIHSLIKVNDFQKHLYSKISNIRPTEIATILLEVLHIYDEYSEEDKIRIPHENEEQERKVKAYFDDASSDYMNIYVNIKYEVYFRNLDLNVALLILENWYVLRTHFKQRFNKPKEYFETNPSAESRNEIKDMVSVYKEIESAIYHFIYRTSEDWRLYLPRDRQITIEEHHKGIYNGGVIENLKIVYDKHKLKNGAVLFLERKSFKERVKQFNKLLAKYVITVDPATIWAQTKTNRASKNREILLDDNYLTPTMYMSDYYSLRKIVFYIEAIENANNISVLMIERVLHVTGEMLKSSNESKHLLESTKSMLQIAMSVETVKYLSNIRDFLSHAEKGHLSIRINIANNQNQGFDDQDWKQNLKTIKRLINSVLDIYKPILDKSLLEKGKRLLDERIKNLPHEAARHIDEINRRFKIHGNNLIDSKPLFQELIVHTGLTTQLLKEIFWMVLNKHDILLKIQLHKKRIDEQMFSILPTYIQNIRQILQLIDGNNRAVEFINQRFKNQLHGWKLKELPKNPGNEAIADRQRKLQKIERQHKNANVGSLLLILNGIKSFSNHWKAINKMLLFCYEECEQFGTKPQMVNDVPSVIKILDELDDKCRSNSSCKNLPVLDDSAIKTLHDIFEKHKPTEIAREELISCLINRVNLLKQILQYSQHVPLKVHIRQYKHDLKFRFELEMVLADITNVLVACKIKRLMYKSGKLLREIDLGNVLDHGNPFLDVIGDIFDSNDVATALLSKAIMFAEDAESIEALFELFKAKVDYVTIKNEALNRMNDQQKDDYKRFQKSPNWQCYADLIKK